MLRSIACLAALATTSAVAPPLRTKGNQVIDSSGAPVRLSCVNWYGAHMERFVVNGLDQRPLEEIAADVSSMGFNCVRLVFSNALYVHNPNVTREAVTANPSFVGQPAMMVFDAVVEALTSKSVMVILNNHNSDAGWCCSGDDGNGLWYNERYPAEQWQEMWVELARRYAANALVVGADLRNEIRTVTSRWSLWERVLAEPSWGDGDVSTDWKMAAENCGNAVLKENCDLLIIVEGLNYALDLTGAMRYPVKLSVPGRLVYSGHIYSWSGFIPDSKQSFEAFSENMWQKQTFVTTPGQNFTAPFWLGEIGSNANSTYWQYVIRLLESNPSFGWAYWALDGYKHDSSEDESFGIFEADFKTIRHHWKLQDLQTLMATDHDIADVVV